MHYIVERVHKSDPFGDIIDSSRRAGNEPGRAQAYTMARQFGKRYPEQIIFVTQVISREEIKVIAIVNSTPEVTAKYPDAEVIKDRKQSKHQQYFDDMVKSHMTVNNSSREVAIKEVCRILAENTQVETGS